jgi:hypothetical protein
MESMEFTQGGTLEEILESDAIARRNAGERVQMARAA